LLSVVELEEDPTAGEIADASVGEKNGGVAGAPATREENEELVDVNGETAGAVDGRTNGEAEGPFARRL